MSLTLEERRQVRRVLLFMCTLLGIGVACWWFLYARIVPLLADPASTPESLRGLTLRAERVVTVLSNGDGLALSRLGAWQLLARKGLTNAVTGWLFLTVVATGWTIRERLQPVARLRTWLLAEESPLNLALFRIVLLGVAAARLPVDNALASAALPSDLHVFPFGLQTLGPYLPVSVGLVAGAATLFTWAVWFGLLGLFTRPALAVAAATAGYVAMATVVNGKVDHGHHLIWCLLLLATSRCGDALSLDALIAAVRRADRGATDPPAPSVEYGFPIRVVWVLMGLVYFFPGFWKLSYFGIDWVSAENMRALLHSKWLEFEAWTPMSRVDRSDLLLSLGAIGGVVFEIGFVFAIFFTPTRLFWAAWGQVFHYSTIMFMRIDFGHLSRLYPVFIDWQGLVVWLGKRLAPDPLTIVYDGRCRRCRRTIAILRAFDFVGRSSYVDGSAAASLRSIDADNLGELDLTRGFLAVHGGRVERGYDAYARLARRHLLLLPAAPFLTLSPVRWVGERIYRWVAETRTCTLVVGVASAARSPRSAGIPVLITSALLVVGNTAAGVGLQVAAWPFACYPTFHDLHGPLYPTLEVRIEREGTAAESLDRHHVSRLLEISASSFPEMARGYISRQDTAEGRVLLNALARAIAERLTEPETVTRVHIHVVTLWTDIDRQTDAPPREPRSLWDYTPGEGPKLVSLSLRWPWTGRQMRSPDLGDATPMPGTGRRTGSRSGM